MLEKEKARWNGPIPNAVVNHDATESKAPLADLQARPLTQARAKQLARVVFGCPPSGVSVAIGSNGLPYWRSV